MEKKQTEYKYKIGEEVHIGNFHAIIIGHGRDKRGRMTYKYKCLKCGYDEGEKVVANIDMGYGCPCCTNRVVVRGINDITTTDPWMIPYFQGGEDEASLYTKSCNKKIIPKCPDCGRIKEKQVSINTIYTMHGIGCACKDGVSFANKFIFALMEQLFEQGQITYFKREFTLQRKLYDMFFIVNNKDKYLVEMDGGFNHGNVIAKHPHKGRVGRFVPVKHFLNDDIKDKIAKEAGIPLIRVDCYETKFKYIKNNVINSDLSKIVNLEKINWDLVQEFCATNLVKKICDYKKEHPEIFSTECAKIFQVSDTTVVSYWEYGNELGWCSYNPKGETKRKMNAMTSYYNANPIIVENLTTGEKLRFKSESNFVLNSQEVIGQKVTRKILSNELKKADIVTRYEGFKIYKEEKEKK